jgi:ubiquitin carboxyl-terminal hydrolase 14
LKGLWKGVLKEDFDLATIDFASLLAKSNSQPLQVLMMGSATKLVGPKVKTVFIEDLPEVISEKRCCSYILLCD